MPSPTRPPFEQRMIRRLAPPDVEPIDDPDKGANVIGFGATALCGFIVGIFAGLALGGFL